jgi:hypothetical protein
MHRKLLAEWSVDDVLAWLNQSLKLPQYEPIFKSLSIDGEMLQAITEQDLKQDLDIRTRLHRIKMLAAIQRVKV